MSVKTIINDKFKFFRNDVYIWTDKLGKEYLIRGIHVRRCLRENIDPTDRMLGIGSYNGAYKAQIELQLKDDMNDMISEEKNKLNEYLDTKNIVQKAASLGKAVIFGKRVSPEIQKARYDICSKCDKVRKNGENLSCGICGCKIKGDRSLVNLTLYEETVDYGCKHPSGSRWKSAGV